MTWLMQVGSDPTEPEVQAVKDYVQQHRSEVKVVRADWLRCCGQQRSLLAASNGYLMPLATLAAPAPHVSPDKQDQTCGTAEGDQVGQKGGGVAGQRLLSNGQNGEDSGAMAASQAPKHQALQGYW